MDTVALALAFLGFTALGVLTGAATGLSPGLHVNNVAALVLATQAAWASAIMGLVPGAAGQPDLVPIVLGCFLVATATSHAIFDFVPSVFFGAPSEESALSVLPGHRMLLRGQAALAIGLAARGALIGALASAALLVPLRLLLADPVRLFDAFRPWTAVFLVALLASLLIADVRGRGPVKRRIARAAFVQGLAAALGIAVLRGPSGLPGDLALFPLFSGLFGMPGLLLALRGRPSPVPPQRLESLSRLNRSEALEILRGTLAGAAVSWLPGLSGGAAATLASVVRGRPRKAEGFMAVLGAVATSTAILSVGVLFIIRRARSGVAAAIRDLLGPSEWLELGRPPDPLLLLAASAVVAAAIAAPACAAVGRVLARRWPSRDPRRMAMAILLGLTSLIALLLGPAGLLVAALAALVGTVPVVLGVRRVHLMASLLVPVLLASVGG